MLGREVVNIPKCLFRKGTCKLPLGVRGEVTREEKQKIKLRLVRGSGIIEILQTPKYLSPAQEEVVLYHRRYCRGVLAYWWIIIYLSDGYYI